MIATIATAQIRALRRQRIFLALLGMFLAMTAIAGGLGWSSHRTILGVYNVATDILAASGQPAPPNPFLLKPPLSLLSNMVIYVPLIGALMALLLGHLEVADDESGRVGRLVFSRPVSRTRYFLGKVAAAAIVLAAILAASLAIAAASVAVVNRSSPSLAELSRLGAFYALSWLYLMVFGLIGMVAVLRARSRSLSLLAALGAWLVVTFVVPQFTSGLRPVASLNPILDPAGTSQPFFRLTALARPLSIVEQFKVVSGSVLQTTAGESVWQSVGRVVPLIGLLFLLTIAGALLVRHHDFSQETSGE